MVTAMQSSIATSTCSPPPGPPRRQRAHRGVRAGDELAEVAARGERRPLGDAPRPGRSAPRLQGELGGRPAGPRPGRAERGDAHVHPPRRRHSGRAVVGHDDLGVKRGVAGPLGRRQELVQRTRPPAPQRVPARRLDHHDIGAGVGQQLGAVRAGNAGGGIDDPQPLAAREGVYTTSGRTPPFVSSPPPSAARAARYASRWRVVRVHRVGVELRDDVLAERLDRLDRDVDGHRRRQHAEDELVGADVGVAADRLLAPRPACRCTRAPSRSASRGPRASARGSGRATRAGRAAWGTCRGTGTPGCSGSRSSCCRRSSRAFCAVLEAQHLARHHDVVVDVPADGLGVARCSSCTSRSAAPASPASPLVKHSTPRPMRAAFSKVPG